jgi:two-component system alkaline phosphatase synthesis response regulator PhoP
MKKRVLIIEDEAHIVELLTMALKQNNYQVSSLKSADQVISTILDFKPDCLLLDVMLPGKSGFDVCREVKTNQATANLPIILLTAKAEENDKLLGFELGADDYITKPFGIKELFARIEALLRRAKNKFLMPAILKYKDLVVNDDLRQVSFKNVRLGLTPSEYQIIKTLLENKGRIVKRVILTKLLNITNDDKNARSLDVHIRNIRTKFAKINPNYDPIRTLKTVGFTINE